MLPVKERWKSFLIQLTGMNGEKREKNVSCSLIPTLGVAHSSFYAGGEG